MASLEARMASATAARPRAAAPAPDPRLRAEVRNRVAFEERGDAVRRRAAAPDRDLDAARSLAERTLQLKGQLKGLRTQKQDLESQLRQALSAKLHKESEHGRIAESILDAAATNESLKRSLVELRNKRDTYAAVIADQLQDLQVREEKDDEDATSLEDLEVAASWYSKFLGFKVIGGVEGVRFVFDKIDPQCPEKEYSFCIKLDKDTYSLVQSDPPITGSEELVKDLNLSGDLFKFVRIAREKFQPSESGNLLLSSVACPEVPSVPFSPPVTTAIKHTSKDVPDQSNSRSKNKKLPAKRRAKAMSPVSTRRSPRFQAFSKQES